MIINSFINAVICGSESFNEEIKKKFLEININAVFLKTINIVTLDVQNSAIFDTEYDYIVITSKNSVTSLNEILIKENKTLKTKKIICIGKKTKEVFKDYFRDFNIDELKLNSSTGILHYFLEKDLENKKILIPGSKLSNLWYVDRLKLNGAEVHFVPIYDNLLPDKEDIIKTLNDLGKNNINLFIFNSPSAFNNLVDVLEITNPMQYFDNIKIAAIGGVTKNAIEEKGVKVDIVPENYNYEELIKRIKQFYYSMEHL